MTDTTHTHGGEPMTSSVTHYGHSSGKSNETPEDLQPYMERVEKMHPIDDAPANVAIDGGDRPALELKIDGLSPDDRREVYAKLAAMPKMDALDRAKYESKLVAEVVRSKLGTIRSMSGLGPDALPHQREMVEIAGQVRQLQRQKLQLTEDMDQIASLRQATDPVTGELVAEPVYALSDQRRKAYAESIQDMERRMRLLVNDNGEFGIEGARRMQKAKLESAILLQRRDMARSEEALAQRMATDMVANERIAQRARTIASIKRAGGR